eukprot:CAMPEP_0177762696 /NCGR_PEP_ID=MMETSP0491_2-20121128/6481_1 /TAXON_ID=63592 /ORGANISM="Tetraselmis chuii, Strain PLY429" /LENGTH=219 /DNA_ID=CAMNT_0019278765 /DNA_START=195 /DNA_END=854 /DNA_ORIENTATION=+
MALRLKSMNHVSRVCSDVATTKTFYENVLGFVEVRRPSQLEESLNGCWLFGYGMGIHLIGGEPPERPVYLNPKLDHISFQCESFAEVVEVLTRDQIPFVREVIRHDGVYEINQVFFHDPDRNMIEICTCECMPTTPLRELMTAKKLGADIPIIEEMFETVSARSSMDTVDAVDFHGMEHALMDSTVRASEEAFAKQPLGVAPHCNSVHVRPEASGRACS